MTFLTSKGHVFVVYGLDPVFILILYSDRAWQSLGNVHIHRFRHKTYIFSAWLLLGILHIVKVCFQFPLRFIQAKTPMAWSRGGSRLERRQSPLFLSINGRSKIWDIALSNCRSMRNFQRLDLCLQDCRKWSWRSLLNWAGVHSLLSGSTMSWSITWGLFQRDISLKISNQGMVLHELGVFSNSSGTNRISWCCSCLGDAFP